MSENEDELDITLSVTGGEFALLQIALGSVITRIDSDISEWENEQDYSLDILCKMYEKQVMVMGLWRKIMVGAGVPEEAIIEAISEGLLTGGEDE